MSVDPLSPIAPARVRALVLPVGKIRRARFLNFVERLQQENVVRLGDISPDARPNRNMFSPLGFASGMMVYDLSISLPPASHLALSPFEQHREPLTVIAIADGSELIVNSTKPTNGSASSSHPVPSQTPIRELDQELESVRDLYPKALVHHLLIFDYKKFVGVNLPEGLFGIPPVASCKTTTLKTIMCDMSSMLLAEMTTLAKSFQGRATIESPNQVRPGSQSDGYSWHQPNDGLTRRDTVYSTIDRAEANGVHPDKGANRMTMPASMPRRGSNGSAGRQGSRPSTPVKSESFANPKSPDNEALERSKSTNRDRISVQGFGSGLSSDMARSKGKARVTVVLASLYLQAGRWNDSIKELAEAAAISKSSGDHLWHAKALELIVVNMLMLAWAGLDFQVPQICYASAEKPDLRPASVDTGVAPNHPVSVTNLASLLPELLSKVLHLYERSSNRAGEALPQLAFSQSAIRFSKVLSTMHLVGGKLNGQALEHIVTGKPISQLTEVKSPRFHVSPTRSTVTTMLFRAFPLPSANDHMSVVDRTIVLGGIASTLGELGYYRKKAMVMRDLISVILPGLIQARIVGAAELGIHPSAGAAALGAINSNAVGPAALELGSGNMEAGMDELLKHLGNVYGVIGWEPPTSRGNEETDNDSNEATIARIMRNARTRVFGSRHMKMNVLRASRDLLEALPDHHSVLRFVSDLLRTAGSGIAPGPKSLDASPNMSREEQVRLVATIHKYVAGGKKLGLHNLGAEYWDEFLVRGVELEPQPAARTLMPHQASVLGNRGADEPLERNPFIYNPFTRRPDAVADSLLIADENALFKITLQNPYDVDLEIESVKLEASGVEFSSAVQRTVVGPYRTQVLSIGGVPRTAGELTITGCLIKVAGCRERRFPVFKEAWSPMKHIKIKKIGLGSMEDETISKFPGASQKSILPEITPPKISTLTITVAKKQPVVVVKSASLSQSAIMVLEGERQCFSVTLQNLSQTTPTDLLLFSFQDSTQTPLQTALANRDASPIELHEYELVLLKKQALRYLPCDKSAFIAPGATATFEFEILGKPGLTNCTIQVDYCHLGVPTSEVKDKFYTRQVTLPLTVTVNAAVELSRIDVLPLSGTFPRNLWPTSTGDPVPAEECCLLTLDIRNAWPGALHVKLGIDSDRTVEEDILPGMTSRMLFPIKRIFLQDPYASIPALDPSRQRQFVVSTQNVLSPDSERAIREAFWYREEILSLLSATWETTYGRKRSGLIELRGMRLGARMIEALKIEDVGIKICVVNSDKVRVDQFQQIRFNICNRTKHGLSGILRVQPSLLHYNSAAQALDLAKRLVWDGTLQFALPDIEPGGEAEIVLGLTALYRGMYSINASVEESKVFESKKIAQAGDEGYDNTEVLKMGIDGLLAGRDKERKIWFARESCVLDVKDAGAELSYCESLDMVASAS